MKSIRNVRKHFSCLFLFDSLMPLYSREEDKRKIRRLWIILCRKIVEFSTHGFLAIQWVNCPCGPWCLDVITMIYDTCIFEIVNRIKLNGHYRNAHFSMRPERTQSSRVSFLDCRSHTAQQAHTVEIQWDCLWPVPTHWTKWILCSHLNI